MEHRVWVVKEDQRVPRNDAPRMTSKSSLKIPACQKVKVKKTS